jgi:hypothetical protein
VPHKIGDETSGDKYYTLVESNTNVRMHEANTVSLQLEFPQSKTPFGEMATLKSGGLKVMCVKLLLQKQHLKHKKCYT